MTRKYFIDCLRRLDPRGGTHYLIEKGHPLPEVSRLVIEYCFINMVPEGEDTETLRKYCKAIETEGYYEFKEAS